MMHLFDFLCSSNWKCLPNNRGIYRKQVERISFIDEAPVSSDLYECLLKGGAAAEKCVLTGRASRKRGYCISYASTWSVPNTPRSPC